VIWSFIEADLCAMGRRNPLDFGSSTPLLTRSFVGLGGTDYSRQAGFYPVCGPEFTTDLDTLAEIGHGPPSWTVYYASQVDQLAAQSVAFVSLSNPEPPSSVYLATRLGHARRHLDALIQAYRAATD
jgi:hypothetical protein